MRFILHLASRLAITLASCSSLATGILIIAPHPDDDVLIAAGVALRARTSGEHVTVAFMANGDKNGISTGNLRQSEAVNAQVGFLGAAEGELIFLGYPDGYLADIYKS